MDDEGLYDSLEEEFSSASSSSLVLYKPIQNSEIETNEELSEIRDDDSLQTQWMPPLILPESPVECSPMSSTYSLEKDFEEKCNIQSSIADNQISNISLIVPLYDGDRNKCDIRRSSQPLCSPVSKDDRLSATGNDNNEYHRHYPKKRSVMTNCHQIHNNSTKEIVPKTCSKSYLAMFRARMGCPEGSNKKQPDDTVRSICGDSERSNLTEVSMNEEHECVDIDDSRSDTTSFYIKHIEECNKLKSGGDQHTPSATVSNSTLNSISQLEFSSISEASSNGRVSAERKSLSTRRTAKPLPIPALGGLGPDIMANQEKLN